MYDSSFDMETVREIVGDFAASTGISCRFYNTEGEKLFCSPTEQVCAALCAALDMDFRCEALHAATPDAALRFGGRYIYFCPLGLAFFASPVMNGGSLAGALVAGPVRIMETEDQLSGLSFDLDALGSEAVAAVKCASEDAPPRNSAQLQALSRQLFANAVYLSDSGQELLLARDDHAQGSAIENYIAYLKSSEGIRVSYPMDKEQALFRAVVRGDRDSAGTLLNQILGHIYFYALDNEEIHVRITELFVVLMRAAAVGGANIDRILNLSRRCLWEIRNIHTQEALTSWLASALRQLTDAMFPVSDTRHSDTMEKAMRYIRQKFALHLTLEDVAQFVGYSPAYFSRIFREDTGMTFKEYLNELRIERAKSLLLTTELSVTEISSMLGCSDQSYFCKIFRRATGVSPDKYRKRSRRLDYEKEHGSTS